MVGSYTTVGRSDRAPLKFAPLFLIPRPHQPFNLIPLLLHDWQHDSCDRGPVPWSHECNVSAVLTGNVCSGPLTHTVRPITPHSKADSPFPLVVKCRNSTEASQVIKLQPLTVAWSRDSSCIQLAQHIHHCFEDYGVSVSGHFYPCWKSSKNAIYSNL